MCSVKSGASGLPAHARVVEMASEPHTSTVPASPRAIALANSVIKCWGECPPTTSSTARRGTAPTRAATERGKLFELPQRCGEHRAGDLELPDAGHRVNGGRVDAGTGDRRSRRGGGQIDGAPAVVVGGVDRVAGLADPDQHRGT